MPALHCMTLDKENHHHAAKNSRITVEQQWNNEGVTDTAVFPPLRLDPLEDSMDAPAWEKA